MGRLLQMQAHCPLPPHRPLPFSRREQVRSVDELRIWQHTQTQVVCTLRLTAGAGVDETLLGREVQLLLAGLGVPDVTVQVDVDECSIEQDHGRLFDVSTAS